jgi:hypothetical protein
MKEEDALSLLERLHGKKSVVQILAGSELQPACAYAYFVQLPIGDHVAARRRSFEETKDGIAFNASLLLPVDNERSRVSWPSSRKAQVQASTHIQGTTVLMKAICSATVPLPWNSVNQIGRGANALMASAHSYSAQVLHASGP